MNQLDTHGDGRLNEAEFGRLGEVLLGEEWDEERMRVEFARAGPDHRGLLSYRGLYCWLVHNAVNCDNGRARRHRPASTPLAMAIPPSHLELFKELDLSCCHRVDLIDPARKVSLASHLVSVYTILKDWGAPDAVCMAVTATELQPGLPQGVVSEP